MKRTVSRETERGAALVPVSSSSHMMQIVHIADPDFPHHTNVSCMKPKHRLEVFFVFLLIACSVLVVILNLLVIISVSHFRQLHTPTNLLLLSLAVSDLLQGVVMVPGDIIRLYTCSLFGEIMNTLHSTLALVITSASVGNMVLISVDRNIAICCSMHYSTRVTVRRVQTCICLCWLGAFVFNTAIVVNELSSDPCYDQCLSKLSYTSNVVDIVVTFIIPVCAIIILYTRVFVVAVSQARAMRRQVAADRLSVKIMKSELKAARVLGAVVALFLMCFCPYYILSIELATDEKDVLNLLTPALSVVLGTSLNPVIYALFYPWFRKAIRLIVTLQILQPFSRDSSML